MTARRPSSVARSSGGPALCRRTTSARLVPLPIELFAYLKYSFDPTAAAVSAFAIGVALVLVLGIARFMGLEEFTGF